MGNKTNLIEENLVGYVKVVVVVVEIFANGIIAEDFGVREGDFTN